MTADGTGKMSDMKFRAYLAGSLWLLMGCATLADSPRRIQPSPAPPPDETYAYLARRMDQYHRTFYVYGDFSAAITSTNADRRRRGGHRLDPARGGELGSPASGLTCIVFLPTAAHPIGGWTFLPAFGPTQRLLGWGATSPARATRRHS